MKSHRFTKIWVFHFHGTNNIRTKFVSTNHYSGFYTVSVWYKETNSLYFLPWSKATAGKQEKVTKITHPPTKDRAVCGSFNKRVANLHQNETSLIFSHKSTSAPSFVKFMKCMKFI